MKATEIAVVAFAAAMLTWGLVTPKKPKPPVKQLTECQELISFIRGGFVVE